ncbi:MAG: tetraacyldisaccharide 4'-kinase [Pseudomonadota bacterium]
MTLTQEIIHQAWRRKNALFYWVLVPLSWVFALASLSRRWAYRLGLLKSHALPVPVVIVGNIHVGGSGKTPVVIWLVEQLKQQGYAPAVISRGYGGSIKLPTEVYANSDPKIVGDEPVLIANRCNCPVFVGADRVHVGLELLKAHPSCNVIISDDGLQHYRLKRDMEIAVIDAETYLKNARLLPAGSLREPMRRLRTVDAIIKNGHENSEVEHRACIVNAHQMQLIGDQFYNLFDPDTKASAVYFKRNIIKAMAGIGNPARFYEHLRQLGLNFSSSSFDDHHAFTAADLAQLECDVLMMTEKDAVKCKPFAQSHHWVLPIQAKIEGNLMHQVLKKLQKRIH